MSIKNYIGTATVLSVLLFLNACVNPDTVTESKKNIDSFAGNWLGNGVDSEGNEATFAAKVIAQGDHQYQILILDSLDTENEPMYVMEGVMKENQYIYTAAEGTYIGGGKLDGDTFEGYYKGPVDGTFKMWRIK